jgi:hypothetical protein
MDRSEGIQETVHPLKASRGPRLTRRRERKGVEAMKHLKTLATVALLATGIFANRTAARAEDLSVDPSSWDYGEVAPGASVTRSFTFTSIGTSDVSIYLLQTEDPWPVGRSP